ncbi:MAG: sigma factor-like helix-turn-helix DNA-binding protein [Candidatus Zixiibacteriota bacterium]
MVTKRRIVYQNWRVETASHAPQAPEVLSLEILSERLAFTGTADSESARTARITLAVRQALTTLTEDESEFIYKFHFEGITYREMSELTGRPVHKLEALHHRAIRKLRTKLARFVEDEFGLRRVETGRSCLICSSGRRKEIDELIESRGPCDTWKPVIRAIRDRFGLRIKTPQQLIGHEKYH